MRKQFPPAAARHQAQGEHQTQANDHGRCRQYPQRWNVEKEGSYSGDEDDREEDAEAECGVEFHTANE